MFHPLVDGIMRAARMLEEFPRQQTLLTPTKGAFLEEDFVYYQVAPGKKIKVEILVEVCWRLSQLFHFLFDSIRNELMIQLSSTLFSQHIIVTSPSQFAKDLFHGTQA